MYHVPSTVLGLGREGWTRKICPWTLHPSMWVEEWKREEGVKGINKPHMSEICDKHNQEYSLTCQKDWHVHYRWSDISEEVEF